MLLCVSFHFTFLLMYGWFVTRLFYIFIDLNSVQRKRFACQLLIKWMAMFALHRNLHVLSKIHLTDSSYARWKKQVISVNQPSVWWEIVHFALRAISKCKYCQQRNYSNHSNAQKEKKDLVQKNRWYRSQSKSTCTNKMGDGEEQRLKSKCKCYGDAAECYTVCIKCCIQCVEYKTTHTQRAQAVVLLQH